LKLFNELVNASDEISATSGVENFKIVNPDEEFAKDTCYRDIPSVDNSLFTIARNLILEAKK